MEEIGASRTYQNRTEHFFTNMKLWPLSGSIQVYDTTDTELLPSSCVYPESFVRGGPILKTFCLFF